NNGGANLTVSRWVSPTATATQTVPIGSYIYTVTTFDMTGLDVLTADIAGRWRSDNDSQVFLNGNLIAGTAPWPSTNSFETWNAFSVANLSYLLPGVNTLEFRVINQTASPSPQGLRVEFSTASADALP